MDDETHIGWLRDIRDKSVQTNNLLGHIRNAMCVIVVLLLIMALKR